MSRLKTDAIRNVNASVDGITLDTSGNVAIPNELQLADKIVHTGDTNTLIRFPSADTVSVETAGSERLRIDSSGQVRLNTAGTPAADLHVGGTGAALNAYFQTSRSSGAYHHYAIGNSGASLGYIGSAGQISASGGGTSFAVRSEGDLQFCAGGGTERLRIDSSGRILVATTSYKTNLNSSADAGGQLAQFVGAADNTSKCVGIFAYSGTSNPTARGAKLQLHRARSTDGTTNTAVATNDLIGTLEFKGNDGTNFSSAAKIDCFVEDTSVTADHMGGRLVFSTSADGSAVPTERLRIDSTGDVTITDGNLVVANTHGVDFSASESGGVSTDGSIFDDYEEGAWTPSISAEGTSPTTSGGFNGHYTKIGREVKAYFRVINATVSGGSGQFRLGNLPFTTNQPLGDWAANTFGWYNHDFADNMAGAPILYVGDNSTHAQGLYFRDNSTWAGFDVDNSSGLYYKGCISYTAD